jgi:hypothetical protein
LYETDLMSRFIQKILADQHAGKIGGSHGAKDGGVVLRCDAV